MLPDKHFCNLFVIKQHLQFYVNVALTNLVLYRSRHTVVKVRLQCECGWRGKAWGMKRSGNKTVFKHIVNHFVTVN